MGLIQPNTAADPIAVQEHWSRVSPTGLAVFSCSVTPRPSHAMLLSLCHTSLPLVPLSPYVTPHTTLSPLYHTSLHTVTSMSHLTPHCHLYVTHHPTLPPLCHLYVTPHPTLSPLCHYVEPHPTLSPLCHTMSHLTQQCSLRTSSYIYHAWNPTRYQL